jgi:hypothetical protein
MDEARPIPARGVHELTGAFDVDGAPERDITALPLGAIEHDRAAVNGGRQNAWVRDVADGDFDGKACDGQRAHHTPNQNANVGAAFGDEALDEASAQES